MSGKVIVIGSSNLDIFVDSQFPNSSVLSGSYSLSHGGKGANQACSASRLAQTWLISAHSGDFRGLLAKANLESRGVNCAYFEDVSDSIEKNPDRKTSGVAVVLWNRGGEDFHITTKSTNDCVLPWIVEKAKVTFESADVILATMTVPMATLLAAGRSSDAIFILNASPYQRMPRELIDRINVVVLNEPEFHQIYDDAIRLGEGTGIKDEMGEVPTDKLELARFRMRQYVNLDIKCSVVLTLGAAGAIFWTPQTADGEAMVGFEPAVMLDKDSVVDTTGAGDVLAGTLAACMANGQSLPVAVHCAVQAAAKAVTKVGAIPDMENECEYAHKIEELSTRSSSVASLSESSSNKRRMMDFKTRMADGC